MGACTTDARGDRFADAPFALKIHAVEILRTHVMRPTWHVVAADDIRWLLKLTAPRVNLTMASNYRKFELDERTFKRCNNAITKALRKAQFLTRAALRKVVSDAGVAVDDSIRLIHILLRSELDGLICSGPMAGTQFTYGLLEQRVPSARTLQRDESLTKLCLRYFTSHGPATLRDFVWWSGLTMADAKTALALIQDHLTKMSIDNELYWTASDIRPAKKTSRSACLLPAFDEYLVAYKNRKAVYAESRKAVTIPLQAFVPLKPAEKLLIDKEVDRYGRFLEAKVKAAHHTPATG